MRKRRRCENSHVPQRAVKRSAYSVIVSLFYSIVSATSLRAEGTTRNIASTRMTIVFFFIFARKYVESDTSDRTTERISQTEIIAMYGEIRVKVRREREPAEKGLNFLANAKSYQDIATCLSLRVIDRFSCKDISDIVLSRDPADVVSADSADTSIAYKTKLRRANFAPGAIYGVFYYCRPYGN